MQRSFTDHRRRHRPTINITPLIDVMFLLLIFFMVTATFREYLGIDIVLPEAATGQSQEAAPHEVVVSESGQLYFGQQEVDEEGLRQAIRDVIKKEPSATLVLRADGKADFDRVVRAMDIAREVGGKRLIIPTQPAQDKGS